VALAFLATLLLAPRLWLSTREYPLTPVWEGLPRLPFPLDWLLLALAVTALVGAALLPSPRWCLRTVCAVSLVWAALDQSRWQPYFIHYTVLLATLLLVPWERRGQWKAVELEAALAPARLLLACTYFYSGVQKLNHGFVTTVFPWTTEPVLGWFHLSVKALPAHAWAAVALAAAATEALAGLALLARRAWRPGAGYLVAMHGFIMIEIGPLGRNWNQVVWPWNLAMIAALVCLFWVRVKGEEIRPPVAATPRCRRPGRGSSPTQPPARLLPARRATWGVAFLFGALPALSFLDCWDSYPSFALYSGNLRQALVRIDPADRHRMPPTARPLIWKDGTLDPFEWSVAELGATSYPEDRIALSVGRALARHAERAHVLVRLDGKPHPLTGVRRSRFVLCPIGGGPARETEESKKAPAEVYRRLAGHR
jgi:hypothetical protein